MTCAVWPVRVSALLVSASVLLTALVPHQGGSAVALREAVC
jgi:hypothetical protein